MNSFHRLLLVLTTEKNDMVLIFYSKQRVGANFFAQEIWRWLFIPLRIFHNGDLSSVKLVWEGSESIFFSCSTKISKNFPLGRLWLKFSCKMSLCSPLRRPRTKDKISNDLGFLSYHMEYFFVQKYIAFSRVPNILVCFSKTLISPNLVCVITEF